MNYLFEDLESTATKNTKRVMLKYFQPRGPQYTRTKLEGSFNAYNSRYGAGTIANLDTDLTVVDYLEYQLRDMLFHGSASQKFEPGAARIVILECKWDPICYPNNINFNRIENLKVILEYITKNDFEKFDQNLNNLSYHDLASMYSEVIKNDNAEVEEEITRDPNNKYIIKEIKSFDESREFSKYTNPASRWCLTYDAGMYRMYTAGGQNKMYFCYLPDFKTISKPEETNNDPLDNYGLSLICIIVKPNGTLRAGVTRWNHGNGGYDESISKELAEKLLGVKKLSEVCPSNKVNESNNNKYAESDQLKLCNVVKDLIENNWEEVKYDFQFRQALQKKISEDNIQLMCTNYSVSYIKTDNDDFSDFVSIKTDYPLYNVSNNEDYDVEEPDEDDDEYESHTEIVTYTSIYNIKSGKICAKNLLDTYYNKTDVLGNIIVSRSDGLMNILTKDGNLLLNRFVDKVYGYSDKYACYIDNDKIFILNKNGKVLNKNGLGLEHGFPLYDNEHKTCLNSYGNIIMFKLDTGEENKQYLYDVTKNKFTSINNIATATLISDKVMYMATTGFKEKKMINPITNETIIGGNINSDFAINGKYLRFCNHQYDSVFSVIDLTTGKLINKEPIATTRSVVALGDIGLFYSGKFDCRIFIYETGETKIFYTFDKLPPPQVYNGYMLPNGIKCIRLTYNNETKYFNYYGDEIDKNTGKPINNESYLFKVAAYLLG